MSFSRACVRFACFTVALCSVAFCNQSAMAEEVISNQDVLKMVSAGLGEDVIIAKVREASKVNFQLSIDDLVALRKAGVSDRVVGVMLTREKAQSQNPTESAGVSLRTSTITLPLRMTTGTVSSVGVGWTSNTFMNFPGLHSQVRTHDKRPVLLVTCPSPPEIGRYYLAKLDPDKRREARSLKIGQAIRRMGTPGGRLAPDSSWVLPFDVQEENPGTWRITLKGDLAPGEYGWYVNLPDINDPYQLTKEQCLVGGGLFDFGIDSQ